MIGIDRDPAAVAEGRSRLADLPIELVQGNYCDLPEILEELKLPAVSGILLDLGLSSDQLADANRGFSFSGPARWTCDSIRREANRPGVWSSG